MGKEILTFGNTEIEKKKKNYCHKTIFLRYVDIEIVLVSNMIPFGEKTISTLLVICIMVTKLNY